jgi:hypothetical protein
MPFCFFPQGTNPPVMGEGDAGSKYYTLTRTGVGVYTIRTKDPFLACVGFGASIQLNAPASTSVITWGAQVKNADNTWTLTFTIFTSGAAADIAANANNIISIDAQWRNSTVLP